MERSQNVREQARRGPASDPSARRDYAVPVLACGLLVLAAVFLLVRPNFVDLHVYLVGGEAVLRGGDLYAVRGETGGWFTYPPFAALLFAPLAALPMAVTEVLWTGGVVLCTCLMVRGLLPRNPWLAIAVALALPLTTVVFNMLRFGQIGALLTLLVLLDVVALTRGARYAGVLTGLAAAVKLTPALLLVWMVAVGRRSAAVRGGATFLAAGVLAAAVLPSASLRYWTEALWQTDRVGASDTIRNQSLFGLALRAGVERPFVLLLAAAVALGGILAAAYVARCAGLLWGALVAGCVMVLVTPIAWTHHYTWPLLAAIALLGAARWRLRLLGGAVIAVLLNLQYTFGSSWAVQNARVLMLAALVVVLPLSAAALSPGTVRIGRAVLAVPRVLAGHRATAVGGAVMLGAVAVVGWIVGANPDGPPFHGLDVAWRELMLGTRSGVLTQLALGADALGRPAGWIALAALAVAWYVGQRRWWAAGYLLTTALAVTAVTAIAKNTLLRPRPDGGLVEVDLGSYPSGSVAHLAGLVLAVALLQTGARRWYGILATVLVVVSVGWSRTYLSVQWLTDTLAGAALATGVCLLLWLLFARMVDRDGESAPSIAAPRLRTA